MYSHSLPRWQWRWRSSPLPAPSRTWSRAATWRPLSMAWWCRTGLRPVKSTTRYAFILHFYSLYCIDFSSFNKILVHLKLQTCFLLPRFFSAIHNIVFVSYVSLLFSMVSCHNISHISSSHFWFFFLNLWKITLLLNIFTDHTLTH